MGTIFSMVLLLPLTENRSKNSCGRLDVLQLDQKIKDGQIKELTIRTDEILSKDRIGACEYETSVSDESTRREILSDARELVNGKPRVEVIDENTSQPESAPFFFPLGFGVLIAAHLFTMLVMMGLLPFYIILAVKNERLDQTMRIVWVVLACTIGIFADIVYWYLYIWRKPPVGDTPPSVAAA